MTKHTPEPWHYRHDESDGGTWWIKDQANVPVAITIGKDKLASHGPDARLIAAAPDLLDALTELLEVADLRGDSTLPKPPDDQKLWTARMQTAWDDARNTISKAKGEQQ
jgi:hypothetical protein